MRAGGGGAEQGAVLGGRSYSRNFPLDELWWPAIGALGLGIIGFFVPRVFGVGYDTIGDILERRVWRGRSCWS